MRVADKIELDAQVERELRILSKRRRVEARVQQRASVSPAGCQGLAEQGHRGRGQARSAASGAVAAALQRGRHRGAAARRLALGTHAERDARGRVAHRQHDAAREAGRGHALEHAHAGRASGSERHDDPARVAAQRAQAASAAHLQALARSALRGQAVRRRGSVPRTRPTRHRAQLRREEPDPGAQPHPTGPADEARARRHHDPRLQAQRHDDAVCRAQHPGRHRHLDVPGAAPARGVAEVPAAHRPQDAQAAARCT